MASQAATHGHLLWSAGISGKEEEAPILICLKCGYYTQHRLNALGRQCGKKGPPSALKRIRQGRRPAHPHILLNKLIKVRATTMQAAACSKQQQRQQQQQQEQQQQQQQKQQEQQQQQQP